MATVTGTSGNDYIYNSTDPLTPAVPPPGFNSISGATFAADTIDGGAGDDIIYGSGGADTITGGDGNDILIGGPGADALTGGNGNDTSSYATSPGGVAVSVATGVGFFADAAGDTLTTIENLVGSNFADFLGGDGNDNLLQGGAGNDFLLGGAGNDTLEGGAGADTLDGGPGTDTASYASSPGGVAVSVATGVGFFADAAGDTLTNIENLVGSNFGDFLGGDGNDNLLQGLGGDDVLLGGDGNDTLEGGTGNDTINGGAGNDISIWRNGDGTDTVDGGAGTDTEQVFLSTGTTGDIATLTASGATAVFERTNLVGFKINTTNIQQFQVSGLGGDDQFTVGNLVGTTVVGVSFFGGDGNDLLDGTATLTPIIAGGDAGDDTLYGGTGNDDLVGGVGNDVLVGGNGSDILDGSDGNDFLYGGNGNDGLWGGAGNDVVQGDAGDDVLVLQDGDDYGYGGDGNDYLYGGAGNDVLYGNTGSDVLLGEAGNDFLIGGGAGASGVDYLFGGAGADVFFIENLAGATVISDFNRTQGDVIDLHNITGFTSFANVTSNAIDVASGVVVTVNSSQNIWILGQTIATLQTSDFSFA